MTCRPSDVRVVMMWPIGRRPRPRPLPSRRTHPEPGTRCGPSPGGRRVGPGAPRARRTGRSRWSAPPRRIRAGAGGHRSGGRPSGRSRHRDAAADSRAPAARARTRTRRRKTRQGAANQAPVTLTWPNVRPRSASSVDLASVGMRCRSGDPGVVGGGALHELPGALAAGELAVADDRPSRGDSTTSARPAPRGPRSTSSRRPCGGSSPRSCARGSGRRSRGRHRSRRRRALLRVHPEQLAPAPSR